MGLAQSKFAYADMRRPQPWGCCDRCGFRVMHHRLDWQFDYRGLKLANLRILVDHKCLDEPQPQLKPILVGPDPTPVRDPRPGFAASQMGPVPAPQLSFLVPSNAGLYEVTDQGEVVEDDQDNPIRIIPPGPASPDLVLGYGLANDFGVLVATFPYDWPTTSTRGPGSGAFPGFGGWPAPPEDTLPGGSLWTLDGAVYVVPSDIVPDPNARPVIFGQVSASQLLALGGANLPLFDPQIPDALWNNDGLVCISISAGVGLFNDGGFLQLLDPTGWPIAPDDSRGGSVWNNGDLVCVIPGGSGAEQFFYYGAASARQLLVYGCGGIPTSDPHRLNQLWNNGGVVCVSMG